MSDEAQPEAQPEPADTATAADAADVAQGVDTAPTAAPDAEDAAQAEAELLADKAPPAAVNPADFAGKRLAVGVDVGGSGIKAAAVDLDTGVLVGLRHRVPTPQPSAPQAVVASIRRMVARIEKEVGLDASAPVGVGFPAVVVEGVTKSAANV